MFDWLGKVAPENGSVPLHIMESRLLIAFALGCVAAAIHYITTGWRRRGADRPFLATLVLLSLLIALVTMVIGDNVARAFSLVGTLAIVRFRTVVEDTRDTTFVIFAVVAGRAAGSGYVVAPLLCAPLVLLAAWLFRPLPATDAPGEGTLVLRLAANKHFNGELADVLHKHVGAHRLASMTTARGGTAVDVTYSIRLPAAERVFELVTELNRVEGIQGVEVNGAKP